MASTFACWYRGAPIADAAAGSTAHFDHAYRGSLGSPAIPMVGRSSAAITSGGVSLGGSGVLGPAALAPPAAVGARFGGAATAEAAFLAPAGGGIEASGQGVGGLSTTATASGGLAVGGRSPAGLSASVDPSGGAAFGGATLMISLGYHIYMNDGQGGPIDYSTPVDAAFGPSWASPPLSPSSSYRFGVRAFFAGSGLEEKNIDASAELVLDGDGRDVTWTPGPPIGLRAFPLAGGRLRVEWTAVVVDPRRVPTGFNVYARPGALTDYTTPAAVAPFLADRAGGFAVELGPFAGATTFAVGVRAFNASGEERNVMSIGVDTDASPPSSIASLNAAVVARPS